MKRLTVYQVLAVGFLIAAVCLLTLSFQFGSLYRATNLEAGLNPDVLAVFTVSAYRRWAMTLGGGGAAAGMVALIFSCLARRWIWAALSVACGAMAAFCFWRVYGAA